MSTQIDRRRFLRGAGKALVILPFGSFLLQACYGSSSDGDTPAAPPSTSATQVVYTSSTDDGHSHRYTVPTTAFASPTDQQGDTTNDDGHVHSLSITAADLQNVQLGETVTVTTSEVEGHTHVFTLVKVA